MSVTTTQEDLWKQAANQLNVTNNLAAMEIQSDLVSIGFRSLATDVQNWSGTGKITLSQQTLDIINALNQVAQQASISYTNVQNFLGTTGDTNISAVIRRKNITRTVQAGYYKLKQLFGLS